jgi:hypothetical protein
MMPIRPAINRLLISLLLVVGLLALAGVRGNAAWAATCADYPNQAAAQHAHDTRDADGDGISCESRPCPCAKPARSSGGGRRFARTDPYRR